VKKANYAEYACILTYFGLFVKGFSGINPEKLNFFLRFFGIFGQYLLILKKY